MSDDMDDTGDKLIETLANDVLANLAGRAVRPVALAVLAAEVGRLRAVVGSGRDRAFLDGENKRLWKRVREVVDDREARGIAHAETIGRTLKTRAERDALETENAEQRAVIRGLLADWNTIFTEVARLREEARRFYHADGTYETLGTPEEAVARRIGAAKWLEGEKRKVEIERDGAMLAVEAAHVWAGQLMAQRDALLAVCREYLAWWEDRTTHGELLAEIRDRMTAAVARVEAEMTAAGPGATAEATEGERS